jgi:hypothetical protein
MTQSRYHTVKCYEGLRRSTINSDRIVGAWVEIQTENLSTTHLEHYLWSVLFGKTVIHCNIIRTKNVTVVASISGIFR